MTSKEQIIERCASSVVEFGRIVMPKWAKKPSPAFHYEIDKQLLNAKIDRLNIIAPRGFAKTSVVGVFYPLWHIFVEHIHRQQPKRPAFVVISSKSRYHAVNIISSIKEVLEDSPHFRSLFGDWASDAKSWTRDEVVLRDGTTILARGTGQQVRGLNKFGTRPSLIVLDDPEDENNTKTPEAMEDNLRWLLQGLVPALARDRPSKVVVIGTPMHERGMVNELGRMAAWKTMHYSAIKDNGDSLWPEQWSVEELQRERESYEITGRISVFYREYMCEVVADNDRIFSQWGYYDGFVEWEGSHALMIITKLGAVSPDLDTRMDSMQELDEPIVLPVNIFMGLDPASTTSSRSDRTAIMCVARTSVLEDGSVKRFVLPYVADRLPPSMVSRKAVEIYDKYRPLRTRVEATGYQEMLREQLSHQIRGIIGEKPRASKSMRLEGMQPYFEQDEMYLMKDMNLLEQELMSYPKGQHDDTLDAMYYATFRTFPPMHGIDRARNNIDGNRIERSSWMTY
jgi:predicted phage terminase large subunit-like protein